MESARQIDADRLRCTSAPHILPEVGQLRAAVRGSIRKPLALGIPVSAHIEYEPADWIGASAAVIDHLLEVLITIHVLVLFEGID